MNDGRGAAPRLYVPLDVNAMDDPRLVRAGPMAELLYVRALQVCKRLGTDGQIDEALLGRVAAGLADPAALVCALVDQGAWLVVPGGWQIAAWGRWNLSQEQLDARRGAGAQANHQRWHVQRGVVAPGCTLCNVGHPSAVRNGVRPSSVGGIQSEVKGREVEHTREADAGVAPPPPSTGDLQLAHPDLAQPDPVDVVFRAWQETMGTHGAKLDDKRRRRIRWALANYPLHDCTDAILGHGASAWHRGENPASKKYLDITLTFRSAQHLEGFRDEHRNQRPTKDTNVRTHAGRRQRFYPGTGWLDEGAAT